MLLRRSDTINPQEKKNFHIRIWVSGVIASILAQIIFALTFDEGNFISYLIQGIIFLLVWVLLHYIFYTPIYKWLLKRQKDK